MKMNKPKSFIVLYGGKFIRAYHEEDIDNLIAKNDADIRRLKRTLWLTRATALERLDIYHYISKHSNSRFLKGGDRTFNEACYLMNISLLDQIQKCRAKAEEYK